MGRGVEGECDAKERAAEAGDKGGRDSASVGLLSEHIPGTGVHFPKVSRPSLVFTCSS